MASVSLERARASAEVRRVHTEESSYQASAATALLPSHNGSLEWFLIPAAVPSRFLKPIYQSFVDQI